MENLTLTQAKEVLSYLMEICKNDKSQVKEVMQKLDNYADFEGLKESLRNDDIKISEFLNSEYYNKNNLYYSYEYYVMTREGDIVLIDGANFCRYFDEYTSEDTELVHIGRDTQYYCEVAIQIADLTYIDGEGYYDDAAIDYHDFVYCEDDNEYHKRDNVYFWESDNCYHLEEEETQEEYVRGYHNGSYKVLNFPGNSHFKIGFEIEKEDTEIKESICIDDFEEETGNLWRKERDGSLDDNSGFELISPTMDLNINEIEKHIRGNKQLVKHINAEYSKSCGGHINVSEKGKTGEELFNSVKGFTPLFHALYYGRVGINYSKGKSNERLLNDNDKYQSIKIHDNRIEYRIISAVPNVQTLLWRAKLIDFIMNNQTSDIKQAFFMINTTLKPLLTQIYNTNEKFDTLMNRVIKYTLEFENIELKKQSTQAFIEFNEEVTEG